MTRRVYWRLESTGNKFFCPRHFAKLLQTQPEAKYQFMKEQMEHYNNETLCLDCQSEEFTRGQRETYGNPNESCLLERIEEGDCDAWGWALEHRTDGWYLDDVRGTRFIAAPTASYRTVKARALGQAVRTNLEALEVMYPDLYRPDMTEGEARKLFETL